MWNYEYVNSICNQAQKVNEHRLHIERVLSVKGKTDSSAPYYPKFLKTKLKKLVMEEEENEKVYYENKKLLLKIIYSEIHPSKYSLIYPPKPCPAFNKEVMYNKRMKKEVQKYKDNYNLYSKIFNIKPHYNTKEILQNSENFQKIAKRLQKSIRRINPCLYFQSPTYIKNLIERHNRNKSCCNSEKQTLNKSIGQESKVSKNNSCKKLIKPHSGLHRSQSCQNIFNN